MIFWKDDEDVKEKAKSEDSMHALYCNLFYFFHLDYLFVQLEQSMIILFLDSSRYKISVFFIWTGNLIRFYKIINKFDKFCSIPKILN